MNLPKEVIEKIVNFLVQEFSTDLIILFGSANEGHFREDSDIDIAILSEHPYSDYEIMMAAQKLGAILFRDIDLIYLNKASTVLKARIIGTGTVIYSKDKNREDHFKIRSLKEYALLNEERREIIRRVETEGKIYD